MKALRGSAEEKQLLQRYTRQLDEQENTLATLQREIDKATEEHAAGKGYDRNAEKAAFREQRTEDDPGDPAGSLGLDRCRKSRSPPNDWRKPFVPR